MSKFNTGDNVKVLATGELGRVDCVRKRLAGGACGTSYRVKQGSVKVLEAYALAGHLEPYQPGTYAVGDMVRIIGTNFSGQVGEVTGELHQDHVDYTVRLDHLTSYAFASYELELLQAVPGTSADEICAEVDKRLAEAVRTDREAEVTRDAEIDEDHALASAPAKPLGWRMQYDNSSARRKDQPVTEGVLKYMPAAIRLMAEVSRLGNEKHNPGEPLHHARGKSTDHLDCAARHIMDADQLDKDSGLIEALHAMWRLGVYVQELAERKYGWPKAPNAKG